MLKSFSLSAMAVLVLVGCGSTGSNENTGSAFVVKNDKVSTISGLKSFGSKGGTQESVKYSKVKSSYDANKDDWSETTTSHSANPCESGSMTLPKENDGGNFSFVANNCKNGASTIDGAMSIQVNESQKSGTVSVTRDFSFVEGSDTFSVKKGSKVVADEHGLTANFQANVNDEVLSASNLSVSYTIGDATTISFNSGEVNMGGYYFKFVEQVSPFSGGEQLTSGLLKLVDGAGHKVEIAVVAPDVVELRIDENNDGVFQENEKDRSFN